MTIRRTLLAGVIAIFLCVPVMAESSRIMGGGAGGNGYYFFYQTFIDPAEPKLEKLGGGTIGGGPIHRFMADAGRGVYFGYDVSVEVLPEPDTYRISFGPLMLSPAEIRRTMSDGPGTWSQLSAPDWGGPAVRTIRAGDVLALNLLSNNATGQKIVDYVTVQKSSSQPPAKLGPWPVGFVQETGVARDFRVQDAWMEIRPETSNLDGRSVRLGSVSGSLVYFYLPVYGRFVLSLAPHPELGFQKAGEIRGSNLTFAINSHTLNLVSAGRIAPGVGPFNLYVLHQPTWLPPGGNATMIVGAESLERIGK